MNRRETRDFDSKATKARHKTMPSRRIALLTSLLLWTTVQGQWFLGDFSQSCFSVCNSRSLTCFDGPNDNVNTPLETLYVSSDELGIDCLAVDAVEASEEITSLPRVRVDNDGRNALCQYTKSEPVAICATIPPASYKRFCCCGRNAPDCPVSNQVNVPSTGTPDNVDFDFFGVFYLIGIVLGVLAAIGGVVGGAVGLFAWFGGGGD